MYLHLLDEPQQRAFFRTARYLAEVDGLDPLEAAAISQAQSECGFSSDQLGDHRDVQGLMSDLDLFDHVAVRNVMALELADVVVCDRKTTDREKAAFFEITEGLSLTPEHAQMALDLAAKTTELTDEINEFLSEG